MKQILKYLLFLMIGIIIYILYNGINGFNVGVPWCVIQNPDANPRPGENLVPVPESWDNEADALEWWDENDAIDDDGNSIFLLPIECNEQGEPIDELTPTPTPEAEEGVPDSITITINTNSGNFQLQVPTIYTLQQLQDMINRAMEIDSPDFRYRLILNGTGGLVLGEVMNTLSEGIRNLRQHYVDYREAFPTFTALQETSRTDRTGIFSNTLRIQNRIRQINDCMTEIQNYVRNITLYLGQRYTALYTQILSENQSFRQYQRPENVRYRNHRYRDQPQYLLDPFNVLEYIHGTESETDRFDRVFTKVYDKISRSIERINRNKDIYDSRSIRTYTEGQEYLTRIFERFQNIDRLLSLLFDMLDGMFTLEPTLVDVLVYYNIIENGLTLVLRLSPDDEHFSACASEGVPPSTD